MRHVHEAGPSTLGTITAPPDPVADPTTDEEFDAALCGLLRAAYRNGVSVEGAWVSRNDDCPDRETLVLELEKP